MTPKDQETQDTPEIITPYEQETQNTTVHKCDLNIQEAKKMCSTVLNAPDMNLNYKKIATTSKKSAQKDSPVLAKKDSPILANKLAEKNTTILNSSNINLNHKKTVSKNESPNDAENLNIYKITNEITKELLSPQISKKPLLPKSESQKSRTEPNKQIENKFEQLRTQSSDIITNVVKNIPEDLAPKILKKNLLDNKLSDKLNIDVLKNIVIEGQMMKSVDKNNAEFPIKTNPVNQVDLFKFTKQSKIDQEKLKEMPENKESDQSNSNSLAENIENKQDAKNIKETDIQAQPAIDLQKQNEFSNTLKIENEDSIKMRQNIESDLDKSKVSISPPENIDLKLGQADLISPEDKSDKAGDENKQIDTPKAKSKRKPKIDVPNEDEFEPFENKENVFGIKSFEYLFMWQWDVENDTCAICRSSIMEASPTNMEDKFKDESVVIWGECGHSFHNSCMSLWTKNNPRCPLCQADWVISRIGR